MKIVYITHYTELYGANKSLLDLLDGMSILKNVDIHLVVPATGKITDIATEKNIKFSVIPFYNEIHFGDNRDMGFVLRSIELAKGCVKFFYNWITVIKHSAVFRGCDIIHANSTATLIGAYFAFWMGTRLIWHVREFGWEDYKIKYNFGYRYFQYWFNKADAVIGISKAIYEKRILNRTMKLSSIIYNGIISKKELKENTKNIMLLHTARQYSDEIVFAIVGHISPEKGQLEAISAFQMLRTKGRKVKLLIVGSGTAEYIAELTKYIDEHQLTDITFTGYIENVKEIYTSINCLLMCSKHEALGRVTIEAMSYGIPVIGYNGGGTIEIIRDGYNGMLYSQGYEELYEKMYLFVKGDETCDEYSKHALATVKDYTIEECVASVYDVYAKVI